MVSRVTPKAFASATCDTTGIMIDLILALVLLLVTLVLADILLNIQLLKEFSWTKAVLIPWMNNIGNHVNPNHTTIPGDDTSN